MSEMDSVFESLFGPSFFKKTNLYSIDSGFIRVTLDTGDRVCIRRNRIKTFSDSKPGTKVLTFEGDAYNTVHTFESFCKLFGLMEKKKETKKASAKA